jgi:hypothetical protein
MTIPPLRTFRKAIAAGLAAAATGIGTSCLDGKVTGPELVVGAGLGLLAGAAVYKVPKNATS